MNCVEIPSSIPSNCDPKSNLELNDLAKEPTFDPFDALRINCNQSLSLGDIKKAFYYVVLILHLDRRPLLTETLFLSFVDA
jgi:hypothetical protein